MDISNIHLQFLDLVDLLILHLSTTNVLALNLIESFSSLMASNVKKIPYFSKIFIDRLMNIESYFMLKMIMLPYMSWFNHSILKHVVLASNSEMTVQLLKQFNSVIDYTQPITSYPIPSPFQLMIPLNDSDYTLVATKCDCDFEEVTLQRIVDMKALLVEKWEITEHALQLVAAHIKQRILYWMIPKCVVSIVENKIYSSLQCEFFGEGIILNSIFPANFSLDQNGTTNATSDPFYYILHSEVSMYAFIKQNIKCHSLIYSNKT